MYPDQSCILKRLFCPSLELSKNNGEKPESQPIDLRLSILGVSAAWTADFWLRSSRPGSETLTIKIRYFLQSEKPIVSVSEHVLQIPVVRPFDVATKFASGMFGELSRFYVGEPFVAMPTISSTSPWPIVIESTQLESVSRSCVLRARSTSFFVYRRRLLSV